MLQWFALNLCRRHVCPLLIFVIHAISIQVKASAFATSPDASLEQRYSFYPDPLDSTTPASPVESSSAQTRSSCPAFNASTPQIILSAPLENESVDCGGYREYVYNRTGSCSDEVYFMVVLTVQDNKAPYASVLVSVQAPEPLNSTSVASPSPSRRYYVAQLLSTCPGA
jgi:hypothetical protein